MEERGAEVRGSVVQALPASSQSQRKAESSPPPPPPSQRQTAATSPAAVVGMSSRCTRSQAAPEWTVEESLVLVSEIAALNEDWLKALSSYQKWKMISDNCIAFNVIRSSNQCKRKWDSLLSDYKHITNWELRRRGRAGGGERTPSPSYWSLDADKRQLLRLPSSFDQEVFGLMDAVLKAHQFPQLASGDNSDSSEDPILKIGATTFSPQQHLMLMMPALHKDAAVESQDVLMMPPQPAKHSIPGDDLILVPHEADMPDIHSDSGPEEIGSEPLNRVSKAQEMANMLQGNAEQIHGILRGELPDSASRGRVLVDLTKPNAVEIEFTRRQAEELIKAFGLLVGNLDEFVDLIKDGGCEGIRPMNTMPS